MHESFAMGRRNNKAYLARHRFAAINVCLVLLLMGCERRNPVSSPDQCVWVFESYEPSQWEKEWLRGEESGERRDRECEVLAQPDEVKRSVQLITAITGLVLHGKPLPPELISLFSRMTYARRCGPNLKDTGQRRVQLIEPLIGILRDPLTICPRPRRVRDEIYKSFDLGENPFQSKRHFLIGPAAPWTDTPDDPNSWRVGGFNPWTSDATNRGESRAGQNVLMDMGASLYDGWEGDAGAVGARWFVDRFKRHHLSFDWIVSFEIEKHDPDDIYKSVPDDILPHYIYFNQGVVKSPNGKWNPWRILQGMGMTPNDYIVIKLDIDVPEIENTLIDQLVKEPRIRLLVDEMFFEQHVNVKAMGKWWGTDNSLTMLDTYRLFGYLRSKGVRMHSWP
ncbi:MAG: hypothetical protein MUP52_05355 [Candidatus Aminicenantes bacterium]|nr:hypothetical protein [Candidatus Aminicenantes bacterium]